MGDSRLGLVLEGRYRLEERLAAGGTGIVYRATQLGLNRSVAIKFLHRSAVQSDVHRGRFKREATVMSRLRHPNIAAIIDSGSHDAIPYLVMELCDGTPLNKVIESGPLELGRAIKIARQVLVGLRSAHDAGVIHRDLKPGNILLDQTVGEDHVKVLDFGVAKLITAEGPTEHSVVAGHPLGTPQYMSPEQAKAEKVDHRTDLYAIGVILYEMTTGKRPFEAGVGFAILRQQVEDKPKAPRALVSMSKALESVILTAMQKDVSARFQSAEEMVDALLSVPEAAPAKKAGSRGRWALGLTLLVTVVGVSGWYAITQGWVELPSFGREPHIAQPPSKVPPEATDTERARPAPQPRQPPPWTPPSATVELGGEPPISMSKASVRGSIVGEPFRPAFVGLRVSAGKTVMTFREGRPEGHPCLPTSMSVRQRMVTLELSTLPDEGQVLRHRTGGIVRVGTEEVKSSKWRLELKRIDPSSLVASGRIRLHGDGVDLTGEFDAVYCPAPRTDSTKKPTVNGVVWDPDRPLEPDGLPGQAAAGALGRTEFFPEYANLTTVGDGRSVISFFASPPLDPCEPLRAGDVGVWVGLPNGALRSDLAYSTLLDVDVSDTAAPSPRAGLQFGRDSEPMGEDGTVLALRIDDVTDTDLRGRIYVAAAGHRRSLFVGAFRAVDCRAR